MCALREHPTKMGFRVVIGLQYVIPSEPLTDTSKTGARTSPPDERANRKGFGPERTWLPTIDGEKMDHAKGQVSISARSALWGAVASQGAPRKFQFGWQMTF